MVANVPPTPGVQNFPVTQPAPAVAPQQAPATLFGNKPPAINFGSSKDSVKFGSTTAAADDGDDTQNSAGATDGSQESGSAGTSEGPTAAEPVAGAEAPSSADEATQTQPTDNNQEGPGLLSRTGAALKKYAWPITNITLGTTAAVLGALVTMGTVGLASPIALPVAIVGGAQALFGLYQAYKKHKAGNGEATATQQEPPKADPEPPTDKEESEPPSA